VDLDKRLLVESFWRHKAERVVLRMVIIGPRSAEELALPLHDAVTKLLIVHRFACGRVFQQCAWPDPTKKDDLRAQWKDEITKIIQDECKKVKP
jgi:hypothetical protein